MSFVMQKRVVSSVLVAWPWCLATKKGIGCTASSPASSAESSPIRAPLSDRIRGLTTMRVASYSAARDCSSSTSGNFAMRSQGHELLTTAFRGRRGLQACSTPHNALNLKPCVVIYDGVCHLCNAGVNWIIRVDKSKAISFCALQSRAAEPYLLLCGATREDVLRRFVFIEGPGSYYQASTAALKVASYLPFPYSAMSLFVVVPAPIRDALYDYVAKRRYRWFGQATECIAPPEDVLERFVDKLEIQEKMTEDQSEEQGDEKF